MGWWDGVFGSKPAADDPLKNLDPKLRDFLEKESPVKFPSGKPAADEAAAPQTPVNTDGKAEPPAQDPQETARAAAQEKSLYKDGRYADIWKTYRPLEDVEADTKSSHEKLMDVLEGYKERKTLIGKAALENCSFQQEEWRKCMTSGSWGEALTMCSDKVRRFERCYTMQSRFLRVLGYQAEPDRPRDMEDDIQLHADTLYQRMITHEEAAAKAREEGLAIPAFEILPPPPAAKEAAPAPSEEVQKMWREQVEKLPEEERATEEAALRADYYAKIGTADRLRGIREGEAAERRKRKEEGKATVADHFWGLFGSGPGSDGGEDSGKHT